MESPMEQQLENDMETRDIKCLGARSRVNSLVVNGESRNGPGN